MTSDDSNDTQGVIAFSNRLKKNLKALKSWRRSEAVSCFRVYDRDIPEFAVAVDIYDRWVHVQEYQAPKNIDADKVEQRLQQIMACLPEALNLPAENISLKTRSRQKGLKQYEKFDTQQNFHEVEECGHRFLVNVTDYLDTGLFLDHRITRSLIAERSKGKSVLNLFAYTGSVSVYAARSGAQRVTTVDMSNTYLTWARKNFDINGIDPERHDFVQADCLQWLRGYPGRFDLIFLDPPTFSNSKRMSQSLDIQRDHVELIELALRRLNVGGELVFSNNLRSFKLDEDKLLGLDIVDWSKKTLPRDFTRNPKIHHCWHISVDPRFPRHE